MKTKQLKQLLVFVAICLTTLASTAQSKSERIQKDLDWLNGNTQVTHRYGLLTYDQNIFFSEEGLEWPMNGGIRIIRWNQIAALSETTTGRVYVAARLAPGEKDFFGHGFHQPEYVTPKAGVTAHEVLVHMYSVLIDMGYTGINGTQVIIGDVDEDYVKKKEQQSQPRPEDQALAGFFDLLGQANWEFSGMASFDQLDGYKIDWSSIYTPAKSYGLSEVRLTLGYGGKRFKFNVSPFAFTWMALPSFKKYDEQNKQIEYTDFGNIRYYSPALGFAYSFIPKKQLSKPHPMVEFPITVNFAPLFGKGKTKTEVVKDEVYDSEFSKYFEEFKYNLHGSLGVNLYAGAHFGIGLTVGGTFINVKATKDLLTETVSGKQRKFTYQFDDLSPFIPTAQFKLIFR